MGRRAILGDYGRDIPQSEHGIPDSELMTGGQYGEYRGVSRQRVNVNFKQKLIDRYLDSKGKPKFYPPVTDQQWQEESEPHTISIPTRGQAANGMSQNDVLAMAGDFSPTPAPAGGKSVPQQKINPLEEDEDAKNARKAKALYGQARTKAALHKAQLDELKVLEKRKELVARAGLLQAVCEAANVTRDRVGGIPDYIIDELFVLAHASNDRRECMTKMRNKLREAIEDALTSLADDEIRRIDCQVR